MQRAPRLSFLALLSILFSGCAATLGEDVLDIVETGVSRDARYEPFIVNLLRDVRLFVGPDGAPWLAEPLDLVIVDSMEPTPDPRGGTPGRLFMHRIDDTGARRGYLVPPQKLTLFPPVPSQSMCSFRENPGAALPYLVSFRRTDEAQVVEFAAGPEEPTILCGQRTMVFFQPSKDNTYFEVLRRTDDGRLVHRRIPWPFDARPDLAQGPIGFDDREQVVFVNDGDYRTLVHYLDTPDVVDVGVIYWGQAVFGRFVYVDLDGYLHVYYLTEKLRQSVGFRLGPNGQISGFSAAQNELVTCDWDGLRAVTVPRPGDKPPVVAPQRILDRTPCSASGSQLLPLSSLILYTPTVDPPGSELRSVRIDSPAPPKVLVRDVEGGSARIIGMCQDRAVPYTRDPPERYGPSVNDGWLGTYRFMERGREVRFPPDCTRVFFKEHAANFRRLGELRAAPVPPPEGFDPDALPPQKRLARNVGFNRVTPDGRLIALVDLAVVGPQNRLVIIDDKPDEARGVSRALLHSINAVTGALFVGSYIPGRREVILEVKDTDPGRQSGLLVVTIPPKDEEPDVPPR